ncbi:(d)CMP kinase [Coxiella endosymbiont of Amblyomma sculptum]|uniref:(d)CMP kinase n=1 Tax=Coxiella endosymbiont of Amblyomma sculptum TaxID=2487929 RepID=UPI00132EF2BB|nr:(d)CMP kinase [Coxiella endosymbiont of Amblyomma sculptum]QHG92632.1 (d)CMP kinase [Coxiella endosymbiont of Amblyomma sculptum]
MENLEKTTPPVITIDGLSGSGKGTVAFRIAQTLRWHILDSGIIYRAAAWAFLHYKIPIKDRRSAVQLLKRLQIVIENCLTDKKTKVSCDDYNITEVIRTEKYSKLASKAAEIPEIRQAFLQYQRNFHRWPGLVSDGRDMGTVIFPSAPFKFYLDANPKERARRRYKQLQERGIDVSLREVQENLEERDFRDINRVFSSAEPARDALVIDTTKLSVTEVFDIVICSISKGRFFDFLEKKRG